MSIDADTTADGRLSFSVACRGESLGDIRQAVNDFCGGHGIPADKTYRLTMAVDEWCSNVIEHGHECRDRSTRKGDSGEPRLYVSLSHAHDAVTVEIRDQAPHFDFNRARPVTPSQYRESKRRRGLGLWLIKHLTDLVAYRRLSGTGNCLKLTVTVSPD